MISHIPHAMPWGLLALLVAGCAQAQTQWVRLQGQSFLVEVADTPAERRRGLMYREELPADGGMLFVYERADEYSFWMKNTLIPLDILYFDAERRLLNMYENVPPCTQPRCPSYPSAGRARYVLELKGGRAAALGLKAGDRIELGVERAD